MPDPYDDHGPFDPDELVRWATSYGHPEGWAKKAQDLHAKNEHLRESHDAWVTVAIERAVEIDGWQAAVRNYEIQVQRLHEAIADALADLTPGYAPYSVLHDALGEGPKS